MINIIKLTDCEKRFLNYYLNKYNAKWMRVYNNKHPLFETTVDMFNVFKRKLKNQPIVGERTYVGMFKQLVEGRWYFIPNLLKNSKEENNCQK